MLSIFVLPEISDGDKIDIRYGKVHVNFSAPEAQTIPLQACVIRILLSLKSMSRNEKIPVNSVTYPLVLGGTFEDILTFPSS